MGVTLFNDGGGRQYYRVIKSWDGNHYQEYFPDKALAEERNAELDKRKRAFDLRKALLHNKLINDDGKITGLAKQVVKRVGRKPVEVFKLRCAVPGEAKPKFSTISISQNGLEGAFHIVVEKIAQWYEFSAKDEVYKLLLKSGQYYGLPTEEREEASVKDEKLDDSSLKALESGLEESLQWFYQTHSQG